MYYVNIKGRGEQLFVAWDVGSVEHIDVLLDGNWQSVRRDKVSKPT